MLATTRSSEARDNVSTPLRSDIDVFPRMCRIGRKGLEGGVAALFLVLLVYFSFGREGFGSVSMVVGAGLISSAFGLAGLIVGEARSQMRFANASWNELREGSRPKWASAARDTCRASGEVGNDASELLWKRVYQRQVVQWERRLTMRLQWWYILSAVAVVVPQLGFLVSVSFDKLRSESLPRLMLPGAVGLALGVVSATMSWWVASTWMRLFDEWCEWASNVDYAPPVKEPNQLASKNGEEELNDQPGSLTDLRTLMSERAVEPPLGSGAVLTAPRAVTKSPPPDQVDTSHSVPQSHVQPSRSDSSNGSASLPGRVDEPGSSDVFGASDDDEKH